MPFDDLDPTQVVALPFDEPATAEDLAAWCDGEVTHPVGEPEVVVILVPAVEHARAARVGDWIVREPDGTHRVFSPVEFAARFEPAG